MEQNIFSQFYTEDVAAIKNIKVQLMIMIKEAAEKKGFKQYELAQLVGITAPRASNLMKGQLEKFSVEGLIAILIKMGWYVHLTAASDMLVLSCCAKEKLDTDSPPDYSEDDLKFIDFEGDANED